MSRPKIPIDGPGSWVVDAECGRRDVDMSVDAGGRPDHPAIESKKAVCGTCPVLADCRAWSLGTPDPAVGHIAGGLHPAERARLRRQGVTS